jgi:SAM-dependent methyltransferase
MDFESFSNRPDFLNTDPSFNTQLSSGLTLKNYKNAYIRYAHWATPDEVREASVLDIGCRTGSAGGYVLKNSARRYVGIEKNKDLAETALSNLKKYYCNRNFEIIHNNAETFVSDCTEKFDFVFVGRVLHQISCGEKFLKDISKISNNIVIEDAHPPNFFTDYLLKNSTLNNQQLLSLENQLETVYSFVETYADRSNIFTNFKDFPLLDLELKTNLKMGSAYSIGYLITILSQQGFKENFDMYNKIKCIFPEEYGYGLYQQRDGVKKYIMRFNKK